jgi:mRNA interferase YafQ
MESVNLLAADKLLLHRSVDHPLSGEWKNFSDCHVRPDLVLIYHRTADKGLELVLFGAHSEVGW